MIAEPEYKLTQESTHFCILHHPLEKQMQRLAWDHVQHVHGWHWSLAWHVFAQTSNLKYSLNIFSKRSEKHLKNKKPFNNEENHYATNLEPPSQTADYDFIDVKYILYDPLCLLYRYVLYSTIHQKHMAPPTWCPAISFKALVTRKQRRNPEGQEVRRTASTVASICLRQESSCDQGC